MNTFAFIGMGNMARAIADGFIASGRIEGKNMRAYAPHFERLEAYCAPRGICACHSTSEALDGADTVIMAVKPYILPGVLEEYGQALAGKAVLSVVTGWTLERYREALGDIARVQYVMPNTPCSVRAGMLLFEEATSLTEQERAEALDLFACMGEVAVLPTHLMATGAAVSGCGPAFVAMMIEAMADAGVKYGLPRATAYKLASQTALGTGRMQLETGAHPGAIKDGVCSPGGTTIRGVEALEAAGMRFAFMDAVRAVMDASK
ncbi:MAG: pyrroline-5-carboxylate reductase [Clostridiales bacterium]|nr:pyrroline-5-carboxylate reductase [Clostridiales bacterium]